MRLRVTFDIDDMQRRWIRGAQGNEGLANRSEIEDMIHQAIGSYMQDVQDDHSRYFPHEVAPDDE